MQAYPFRIGTVLRHVDAPYGWRNFLRASHDYLFVGLLSIVLSVCAFGAVVREGVLGGITVFF
jgi:hypothetical protein